jgi:hypothetical protein
MGNTDAKRFASVFPTVILSSLVGHFFTSRSQRTKGKGHREDMARTPKMTEDRREQIIDAPLRVFAQKGFARATNSEIAREAGNMTPGLIYYYFKSKEDLLKVVLRSVHRSGSRRRSIQRCWGCRQMRFCPWLSSVS